MLIYVSPILYVRAFFIDWIQLDGGTFGGIMLK